MDGLRGLMRGVDTDAYASDEEGPGCVCRPKKFGRAEDEGMDEGKRNHEAMMMMRTEAQCRDEEEDKSGRGIATVVPGCVGGRGERRG